MRIGIGYDIHCLVEGRPLKLGGVVIPHSKGLLGHSDGDALLHAIADAMLGALALGDIGRHFPDTDPSNKDIDSGDIIKRVVTMVIDKGWTVHNIDANVIAQEPTLAPHMAAIRETVAGLLGIPLGEVSVKARTNEKLDAVGRGEAIAVQAIVLLGRRG